MPSGLVLRACRPTCVASQPDGGIVVSEAWSHRVRVFDRTGREKAVIGSAGREPGLMIYPSGVAVDQSGHIFVVDSGNHRVQKLSVHGEAICSVGSAGSGDGQFGNPKTIVLASNNLVVISDAGNHRLTVFDKELRWQRHIGSGTEGASDSQFNTPEGLAVWQGRGRFASPLLFVADSENHRVQVLSLPSGKFVRSIGGKGEGSRPGEFALPGGVAVDASRERLLVSECRGRRVQLLSLRGEPLQLVWLPRSGAASRLPVLRSVCCSVDEDGRAYVCDFANHRVAILRLLEP